MSLSISGNGDILTLSSATTAAAVYTPAGTGAQPTTVQSKLRENVSVKDFGAVGDGITDDSAAFAAAVATGKSIFVPKGTYKTSFLVRNGQRIYGEGARNATVLIPPAGATYVIGIVPDSVGTTSKQHCDVSDLSIENPNAVANCYGLYFGGVDVYGINDSHTVSNVYINGFYRGIEVLGRLILCVFTNVEVSTCTKGMNVVTDPADYAYNANTFISCRFVSCVEEGYRQQGLNIGNTFSMVNIEGNNTAATSGMAGMYIEDAQGIVFTNPYFENNGGSVPVNPGNALDNSIGLRLHGTLCFNVEINGGWMVQSGALIVITASVGLVGGSVQGVRFAPTSTGFDVHVNSATGAGAFPPFIVSNDNYFGGVTEIVAQADTTYPAVVTQFHSATFAGGAGTIDLRSTSKLNVNNASGFSFTGISNAKPGQQLEIWNSGNGLVRLPAAVMGAALDSIIPPYQGRSYLVSGYPNIGKLVELNEVFDTTPTFVTTATYTLDSSNKVDSTIYLNSSANCVITMPGEAAYKGRILRFCSRVAYTLDSSAVNVLPMTGGPGTAILAAGPDKWCTLQCNGTTWDVIAHN